MIPATEIKRRAREYGVPVSTIERDYAQGWLLGGLKPLELSFKGGTALKKIHFGDSYRFSDDLDFTLFREYRLEELEKEIKTATDGVKKEAGIDFEDSLESEKSDSGYVVYAKFRITNIAGPPIKIKLDLSLPGSEILLGKHEKKEIIHNYPDGIGGDIRAYSLEEILAEKLRSCFQRTRPRDIYDIMLLKDKADAVLTGSMLEKKFVYKNVEPDIKNLISRRDVYKRAWEASLKHQMKTTSSFDAAFNTVLGVIDGYVYLKDHKVNK